MGHSGMKTILSWRQQRPCGLKRNFCPSFNYWEKSKLGVCSRMRVITRAQFYLSGPSARAGQTAHYQTSALITLWITFLPSDGPYPQLSSGWHLASFCPSLEQPCLHGLSVRMLSLIFCWSVSCQFDLVQLEGLWMGTGILADPRLGRSAIFVAKGLNIFHKRPLLWYPSPLWLRGSEGGDRQPAALLSMGLSLLWR